MFSGFALVGFCGGFGHQFQRKGLFPCDSKLALRFLKLALGNLAAVLGVDQRADLHLETVGSLSSVTARRCNMVAKAWASGSTSEARPVS